MYITKALVELERQGGVPYLERLSWLPHPQAHKELRNFCGVGPKVADCICLFSLDCDTAVPVDTHCWQIACRDYFPHWPVLVECFGWRLDSHTYAAIGERLREVFGRERVGWAFMVLFAGELHPFRLRLVQNFKASRFFPITEKHKAPTGEVQICCKRKRSNFGYYGAPGPGRGR